MRNLRQKRRADRGVTLLETLFATVILTVVATGLLGVFSMSVSHNENQGEIMPRTAEYSQDKIEQLLALSYTDASSDTRQYPTASTGGTGLSDGGSTTTPTTNYVDYLRADGTPLGATAAGSFYTRMWSISSATATGCNSACLKTITVVTVASGSAGAGNLRPKTTLVTYKTRTQ